MYSGDENASVIKGTWNLSDAHYGKLDSLRRWSTVIYPYLLYASKFAWTVIKMLMSFLYGENSVHR